MSAAPVDAVAFFSPYHGHDVAHLDSVRRQLSAGGVRRFLYLAGDSSLDNKFWLLGGAGVAATNGYERILSPAGSAVPDVAHHITKRQIETIALERGRRTDGGDAGAHKEWVESNFDNQTVVAVYFGETCGCAPH